MIYFIGDAGIDHYQDLNKDFLGGCSLNAATHFRRNSKLEVCLIYPSTDASNIIEEHCFREEIKAIPLKRNGQIPTQLIGVKEDGEKDFLEYRAGVLETIILNDQEKALIKSIKGTIVSPLYTQILPFIDQVIAREPQVNFIFDFHDASDFNFDPQKIEKYLNIASFAQFGLRQDQIELQEYLIKYAITNKIELIITRGSENITHIKDGIKTIFTPILVEKVVDSTGAGDAFLGSFLALHSIEKASKYASSVLLHTGSI